MRKVKVVTDSTADLPPEIASQLDISVVPQRVKLGNRSLRDGLDLTAGEFFRRQQKKPTPFSTLPPSPRAFREVYSELSKVTDQILSIHISSKLSNTQEIAVQASQPFLGRTSIAVVDSLSISRGLGMLAIAAAKAAQKGRSLDDIVKLVRAMIPHIYIVFFVETLDYLERGGRIEKAQALLGSMLKIKPLLIVEEGEIVPLEKVRTRTRAIEKLYEFVVEFSRIEQMAIIHSDKRPEVQELIQQIHMTYPEQEVDVSTYGPVLASHVGLDAMGVVVREGI
ncbi:MAG: DegV family protein [Anaerolineae bacterium]